MTPRVIHLALAGNPNAGKTSIFNNLTGANQHVANYPGVTVETKEGTTRRGGITFRVVDLPGTYSLTANSPEEQIARQHLIEQSPDVVIQVVDASNLQRSLYLTLQLIELGQRVVLDLNMMDEARARGMKIDTKILAERLGVEVVQTVANRNEGSEEIFKAALRTLEKPWQPLKIEFPDTLGGLIHGLHEALKNANGSAGRFPPRWAAIKFFEGDDEIADWVRRDVDGGRALYDEFHGRALVLTEHAGESLESLIAETRFSLVAGVFRETVDWQISAERRQQISEKIDAIILNRYLGFPLFLIMMYAMFQFVFTLGAAPMGWIESGFQWLGKLVEHSMADGPLRSLITDGIIGGVGGVIVFVPNIMLLFFAIGLLERSGYMARAAFLMDRIMHRIGLHGRSFIPLLTGFGCSVPAIMATRTLEHEKDRLATMLVVPLMSCSARLPIYSLLVPAFFPVHWRGAMFFLIYAIGVILAVALVKVFRITILAGESTPFVMELPPYRMPTFKSIVLDMGQKSMMYLRKAGTIILAVSVVLWVATSYPKKSTFEIDRSPQAAQMSAAALANAHEAENLAHSVAGRIGQSMEPVFKPLGFDWKVCTALIGALAAKEVFVAQLGIVYSIGNVEEAGAGSGVADLGNTLSRHYSPLTGFCIMLFCLIASPCMATVAVMRRESNSWKWPAIQFLGLTALAWLLTFIVHQVGMLLHIGVKL